jgi:hypothetical protein
MGSNMTPEQREALRQEVIRWIGSKDFDGYLKALHLDPANIAFSLLATFAHVGGFWPWDVIRITNERGLATSSTRRRYLKLAKTGKISLGYICNAEQTPADSKTEYVSAHILASIGGTTEDDELVESCLVKHDALSRVAKSKNFPTSDAGSVSGVFRVGNSAYDYGQPSSIYVFNALLHKSTNIPSKGRPRIVCIVNPHCWPTILPIPFAIAKQCVPTLADERPDQSEEIDWSDKYYPAWQQAMHSFLDKRIKKERRSFYDSLTWKERNEVIFFIDEDLKTVELDAVIAVRTGQTEKLSEFLSKGISPDLKGLMENAFHTDNIVIVSMLLARGANPNRTVNGIGDTLLHEATSHGNPEIVKLLLAKGADPNLRRGDGRKALYCANKQMKEILEPITEPPRLSYNVDDFLKIEDPEKACYALIAAIRKDERFTPAELRVMSLDEFFALGWSQGVFDLYWQRRWAIIPCSELMSAIDEPFFTEVFQRGIAVIREYGQKIGRDPLDPESDYLDLDEETNSKLRGPGMDFYAHHFDTGLLCRKTMDYVRKNRELFT